MGAGAVVGLSVLRLAASGPALVSGWGGMAAGDRDILPVGWVDAGGKHRAVLSAGLPASPSVVAGTGGAGGVDRGGGVPPH